MIWLPNGETVFTDRTQHRAMQRRRTGENEKRLARAMRMPKGLRQYCKNLGSPPSSVARAYLKAGY